MNAKEQLLFGKGDMPKLHHINRVVMDQAKQGLGVDDFNLSVAATVEHVEGREYEANTALGSVDIIFDEELEPGQFRYEMKDVPVADGEMSKVDLSR